MDRERLALALWDMAPVVVSMVGFSALARHVDARRSRLLAWSGVAAIGLAGVSKPTYKTLEAIGGAGSAPIVLDDALFWFLAPGFLLVVAGLLTGRYGPILGVAAFFIPFLAFVLAITTSDDRAWFMPLLLVATIGNVVLIALLAQRAGAVGRPSLAVLLWIHLLLILGLAGAAAVMEATIAVQWVEQTVAVAAQAIFTLAVLRLIRAERRVNIGTRRGQVS